MSNFKNYSEYYDLLYSDKDYKKEVEYIINKIKKNRYSTSNILELGCGSGSHAEFFCDKGYLVTGIERSEEMLEVATSKNIKNFNFVLNDIKSFELNKKFDVAISLFHVISYLTDNKDLISCFSHVNKHLNDDGIFIFDLWYSPAVYFQKPTTKIKRMHNQSISVRRIAESEMLTLQNIVNVKFEILINNLNYEKTEILQEIHPMRHFSYPEMDLLAKHTGFEIIEVEEFLSGEVPSDKTWGVCFTLKKTK
jgi:SAM-dependent methyltransferase